jgi:hypothetical protein
MRLLLCALPIAFLYGCSSTPAEDAQDPSAPGFQTAGGAQGGTTPASGTSSPAPAAVDANLTEVVNVFIDGDGLCTGTLISKTMVVTAGHCLDETSFKRWDVVAPLASPQKIRAARVKIFDAAFEDVAHPDIGVIVLSAPITLPAYAQLTDVTARVAGNGKVAGAVMARKYEDSEAPMIVIGGLEISSGAGYGYEFGLVSKFFSQGGDSGAGLYLVENGKRTHALIGVARQPEPDRNLDHFTRIDASFIAWVKSLGAE